MENSEEQDVVRLVVVDQEEEGMIGHKVRVEERPSRPEPEQGRGRSSLAALLVDVDERLVDGTGERDLNVLAALGVDEV